MHFQQVRLPIDTLVQKILSGRLALPEFQRDFIWTPSQIAELLDTVSRQWPMGSLLLLNGSNLFAAREIDGAPSLGPNGPDLYILDGQQRVTSLFHAVSNRSKYCYFVDFNNALDDEGEVVGWMPRRSFERHFGEIQMRAARGVALISDIWEATAFFEWVSHVKSNERRLQFLKIREEKLRGFHSGVYQVMAIELEEGIGLEALARIFETINRTGVALNAFDLLVAKLYPRDFRLRDLWDDALRSNPILRHYEPNEVEIVKLISLLIRSQFGPKASKGVRQGDILSLEAKSIVAKWDEAISLYVDALKVAMTYGAVSKELVPSWSMILGLAGCRLWLSESDSFAWWRSSIARQTFAQAANTKIVAAFDNRLRRTIDEDEDPISASDILKRSVRSNGLLAKGFAALLVKHGARDPVSGQLISASRSVKTKVVAADGFLLNVTANDTLRNLVVLSGESDERNTGRSVAESPYWKTALLSQGIDPVSGERDESFVIRLFEGDVA